MGLNIIDSIVCRHVLWLETKGQNKVINFLKDALKIIETVGLAVSLVGILLIQKAIKAKKMYQSAPWMNMSMNGQFRECSNSTHTFLLTLMDGKMHRKKWGLHRWKEVPTHPNPVFSENTRMVCNDKELWLADARKGEWYSTPCAKKLDWMKESESAYKFYRYYSVLFAEGIDKVVVQDQENREVIQIPREFKKNPFHLEIDEKNKALIGKSETQEIVLKQF